MSFVKTRGLGRSRANACPGQVDGVRPRRRLFPFVVMVRELALQQQQQQCATPVPRDIHSAINHTVASILLHISYSNNALYFNKYLLRRRS